MPLDDEGLIDQLVALREVLRQSGARGRPAFIAHLIDGGRLIDIARAAIVVGRIEDLHRSLDDATLGSLHRHLYATAGEPDRMGAIVSLARALTGHVDVDAGVARAIEQWTGLICSPDLVAECRRRDPSQSVGDLVDGLRSAWPSSPGGGIASELAGLAEASYVLEGRGFEAPTEVHVRFPLVDRRNPGERAPLAVFTISGRPASDGVATLAVDPRVLHLPARSFRQAISTTWSVSSALRPSLHGFHMTWRVGLGMSNAYALTWTTLGETSVGLAAVKAMIDLAEGSVEPDPDVAFTGVVSGTGEVLSIGTESDNLYDVYRRKLSSPIRVLFAPSQDVEIASSVGAQAGIEVQPIAHVRAMLRPDVAGERPRRSTTVALLGVVIASLLAGSLFGFGGTRRAPAMQMVAPEDYTPPQIGSVGFERIAGRPATSTDDPLDLALLDPRSVAVDVNDDLIISDREAHRLWRLRGGSVLPMAGTGSRGFSGDNGPADQAQLANPREIEVALDGTVFVADHDNNVVRAIAPDGIIRTVAGNTLDRSDGDGQSATQAGVDGPLGLALDGAGGFYVSENDGQRIRHITPDGLITTVAGTGTRGVSPDGTLATEAQLDCPGPLEVDAQGRLLFIEYCTDRVRMIDEGRLVTLAGNGQDGVPVVDEPAVLSPLNPEHLEALEDGSFYVSDSVAHVVLHVKDGRSTVVAGSPGEPGDGGNGAVATGATLGGPTGLSIAADGSLYIADSNHQIVRRVKDGRMSVVAGRRASSDIDVVLPGDAATFRNPRVGSVTSDGGRVYIADTANHVIRVLDRNRDVTVVVGTGAPGYSGDGGDALDAQLRAPVAVALDERRNLLYVSDRGNNVIRMVDLDDGTISTVLGVAEGAGKLLSEDPLVTQLSGPWGLAVDEKDGSLYVADADNHRVLRLRRGTVRVFAGIGDRGFSGDHGSATAAELARPLDVDLADDGRVVITDLDNHRIRVVDEGIITTLAGTGVVPDEPVSGVAPQSAELAPSQAAVFGDSILASGEEGIWLITETQAILIAASSDAPIDVDDESTMLRSPIGIQVESDREILVSDFDSDVVLRMRISRS